MELRVNLKLIRTAKTWSNDQSLDLNLSYESSAILFLIKYCQLVKNVDFECFCYYDVKDFNDDTFIDDKQADRLIAEHLNNKYPHLHFKNEQSEINEDFVIVRSLNNQDDLINDTELPSLIRKINKNIDFVITGLTSVLRNVIKLAHQVKPSMDFIKLLGFRQNCLKACAEVSRWTYLCEVMGVNVYNSNSKGICSLKREFFDTIELNLNKPLKLANTKERSKQKFNDQSDRYLEDRMITLSDLILFYHVNRILEKCTTLKTELELNYKLTCSWYNKLAKIDSIRASFTENKLTELCLSEESNLNEVMIQRINLNDDSNQSKPLSPDQIDLDDEDEIYINELMNHFNSLNISVPLKMENNGFNSLDWVNMDPQVNPSAGDLPFERIKRKCQQLENFYILFKEYLIKKSIDDSKLVIVDFASGGGHLGIFLAYMFPDYTIKLIENKEESLEKAFKRIIKLNLKNCLVYKGNLNNFTGKFNVGVALHACGSLTDLVIEKCKESKADLIISPCCYGSIKENDLISYPRSKIFNEAICSKFNEIHSFIYSKLSSYADKTEKNIKQEEYGQMCMSIIDTDRLFHLKDFGYKTVKLTKMLPEICTTKNNLLIAKYSE